jgi:hypothetical protein
MAGLGIKPALQARTPASAVHACVFILVAHIDTESAEDTEFLTAMETPSAAQGGVSSQRPVFTQQIAV